MFSVVIPVHNRRDNLRLCLGALDRQDYREFEVVVADDGSDEDTLSVLTSIGWHFDFTYVYQPHRGVRIGQARNLGRKVARGESLVFIDSDVILNPSALSHYANIHAANPTAIIAGRYDWLPPLSITMADVQFRWEKVAALDLPTLPIPAPRPGIEGPDPRAGPPSRFDASKVWFDHYCLAVFSGNMLWPVQQFDALGQFDERMVGHGGEDCELAMRAEEHSYPVIFAEEVIGYHIWHPRDQVKNEAEVAVNIEYIRAHHDLVALHVIPGEPQKQLPLVEDKDAIRPDASSTKPAE